MKKHILSIIITIVSLCSGYSFAADLGGYTIAGYNVDMQLHTDGSMDVRETINIQFSESRHGIYREIPIKDAQGEYTHIENLRAIGDPIADNTITNGNYVLKIGDADTFVSGPKIYTLAYTVKNAIKFYGSGNNTQSGAWQELYWNMIGTQRTTSIKNITFSVGIPTAQTFGSGEIFVKRGGYGEKNTTGVKLKQTNDTTIIGLISGGLLPYQGATLGVKFPATYFKTDSKYEKLFITEPSIGIWGEIKKIGIVLGNSILWLWDNLGELFRRLFIISIGGIQSLRTPRGKTKGYTPAWKNQKAITPYYLPPRNIEPAQAFWFRYNAQNPQVFVSLLYYWATKGWAHISYKEGTKYIFGITGKNSYHITETTEIPEDASELDKILLQQFFGKTNGKKDDIELNEDAYSSMSGVLGQLQGKMDNQTIFYTKQGGRFTKKFVLTPAGEKLFDEMRGFREYLLKVEQPALEKEIANDPTFFNKILPWAVLFGTETRILKMCEEILSQVQWYDSYNGTLLNTHSFQSMTSGIQSAIVPPRSSSSGRSGFGGGSGGGGFSGGGGGGGGGGSW